MSSSIDVQSCSECGFVQYPPREVCRSCLSSDLEWTTIEGTGELLSWTRLHHSFEAEFQQQLPWDIAQVKLDKVSCIIANLTIENPSVGMKVVIRQKGDSDNPQYFVVENE